MNFKNLVVLLAILSFTNCKHHNPQTNNEVKIVGEMKNVMWKGQLYGTIDLDTIPDKANLYGLGPVEYLAGEIMIMDGKSYRSVVTSDSTMKVEETFRLKAPFFGYAHISNWKEHSLPDSVRTLHELESYLDQVTQNAPRPFMFKLSGVVESATIHIVNLPKGSLVSSPDQAHQGQVNYKITGETVDIIGFFSTEHKAIFTHHDTFLHLHLMTRDKQKMGHLDEVMIEKSSMKLYLPKE
jgi:acetolactate decarboxylase